LPLEYRHGATRESLGLTGEETYDIVGLSERIVPGSTLAVHAQRAAFGGKTVDFDVTVRIDTPDEAEYYRHGGILQYVLRQLHSKN
jgi:aconitate hydratase